MHSNHDSVKRAGVLGFSLILLTLSGSASASGLVVVSTGTVPADFPVGVTTPVAVPIPDELGNVQALRGDVVIEGKRTPNVLFQPEPADKVAGTPARAWFLWTAEPEQLGQPVAIRMERTQAKPAYRVRHADPLVEISDANNKLILAYRHDRPDPKLKYPMTSYIHPLVGLDGEILTDCSPGDHFHQRGLFWAWVRIMKGETMLGETWIPRDIDLEPVAVKVSEGPVLGRFTARNNWVHRPGFPATPPAAKPTAADRVFQEDLVCRVFDTENGRAVDLDLTLTALQDGLRLGGQTQINKGYGGVTLRFSTEQQEARDPLVIADGRKIEEPTVNHLKALWVDWTGIFNGPDQKPLPHRSGAALFVHPSHPPLPESPPEWITRFYGPINVAYPGLEMLDIPQDKPLRLKYRIWIHRGDATEGNVDAQYKAYAADWKCKHKKAD